VNITTLPTGAVTFLFTDIEGSSGLWERHPEAMKAALAQHDTILREVIESHGGHIVKTTGDGCFAVFTSPIGAVQAAVDAQRTLMTSDKIKTPELPSMSEKKKVTAPVGRVVMFTAAPV